jgi:DNA topoisomerase IB
VALRLRRSDPTRPGWTRHRAGRGWTYLDQRGQRLAGEDAQRCRSLVIPPAWTEVWICPWPNGHLQAVGTDAAGRRQYLYHPEWRRWRDEQKFERVVEFGRALPEARRVVAEHLALPGMPRERALATGFRLMDRAGLRIGGEAYAEANGTVGVATLRRDHVRTRADTVRLRFPGKGGREHDLTVVDAALGAAVRAQLARRSGGPELLAWRDDRAWRDLTSAELNGYVREVIGREATAKDFRTWQGAVRALAALATDEAPAPTKRAVAAAMRVVSDHLGNTPTVARASYVHPVIVERYLQGEPLPTPELPDAAATTDAAGLPDGPQEAQAALSIAEVEAWEAALLELLDDG